jgi:hypothetical protein
MQCLTDMSIFLVAVDSTFKNPQPVLLYRYFRLSLESEYHDFPISTAMSDIQSLNTSLLQAMISSKNERVFIHNLSGLAVQNC